MGVMEVTKSPTFFSVKNILSLYSSVKENENRLAKPAFASWVKSATNAKKNNRRKSDKDLVKQSSVERGVVRNNTKKKGRLFGGIAPPSSVEALFSIRAEQTESLELSTFQR